MTSQLSQRAKELIPKARIVSFAAWESLYPDEVIQIFQQADDLSRYLTQAELEKIQTIIPDLSSSVDRAGILGEKASEIVEKARVKVLEKFPKITHPGGDLYPAQRAEACWRDFWHFLRSITYGIAGNTLLFTSQQGLNNMELLYQELKVPLGAMVCGLEYLKLFSLQNFLEEEQELLIPYFDSLIFSLKSFSRVL